MRRHARARLHRYSRTLDVFVTCDDERRWALGVGGFPFGQVYDLRLGGVRLDRLNALFGACSGVVALAGGKSQRVSALTSEVHRDWCTIKAQNLSGHTESEVVLLI